MKYSNSYSYHMVTQELVRLIAADQLHQGGMLPSASTMAKTLSLSRRRVYGAYCHLSYAGMLEHQKGKGFFLCGKVTDELHNYLRVLMILNQPSPYDVCDLRQIMDTAALSLAFARWDQLDLEQLRTYQEQLQYGNLIESTEADEKSHLWLIRASDNRLMICIMESIWGICGTQMNLLLSGGELALRDAQKKIHETLYKGFLHRDFAQAKAAVQEHYLISKKALQELEHRSPELFYGTLKSKEAAG